MDHSSDRRRFGDAQIANVLREERARRLPDAIHADRFRLPQIDVVEVGLEDFLFGHADLEDHREHGLGQLARQRALGREEHVLGELLSDRASALPHAALTEVHPRGAQQPDGIDPRVSREA